MFFLNTGINFLKNIYIDSELLNSNVNAAFLNNTHISYFPSLGWHAGSAVWTRSTCSVKREDTERPATVKTTLCSDLFQGLN